MRPQAPLRDLLLTQLLRTLADTAQLVPQNPTIALYQESLITTLVFHLMTHYAQEVNRQSSASDVNRIAPLSASRLRAISTYVSEHLNENISLTELAHLAGLSTSQFALRFRETTGQTPHRFVTALRVERARELLVSGQHTPSAVAALTGFADQSHLTRHIRRTFGVTPRALQKQ